MGFLQGKRALITGIASQRSIANGIAEAMHREGAELAFTYQNEKLKSRVDDVASRLGGGPSFALDVTDDAQIDALFADVGKHWPDGFDILVHAIAFAPREAIAGQFLDGLSRESFSIAQDISAYQNDTCYYWDGATSVNASGQQITAGSFVSLDFKGIERHEDGSVDMQGFLELK